MNDHTVVFQEIESNDQLPTLSFKGHQLWSILRNKYWHHLLAKVSESPSSAARPLALMRNLFYGIGSLFGSYEMLCFSHKNNRKLLNERYVDRFTDPICELVSQERCCTIELTNDTHYPRTALASNHIMSHIGIKVLGLLLSRLVRVPHNDTLDTLNTRYGIHFNYQKSVREFYANYRLWLILLRWWRPQRIVVVCYYTYLDVIAAAHELGIEVIEIQHGIIGHNHLAYHSKLSLDKRYLPDTLMTFGRFDADVLSHSPLFQKVRLIPTGSWLLERALHQNASQQRQQLLGAHYRSVVLVTSQITLDQELLAFIKETAALSADVHYLFLPRHYDAHYKKLCRTHKNITVSAEYDFYTLLPLVDVHATVYSTCALEATHAAVTNILIDLNGLATKHFQNLLREPDDAFYVSTPHEMLSCIQETPASSSQHRDYFFAREYETNITRYFQET